MSMYWTVPVVTAAPVASGVTELVNTGRRSPMWIFAFSLLRARSRGLASKLALPFVERRVEA